MAREAEPTRQRPWRERVGRAIPWPLRMVSDLVRPEPYRHRGLARLRGLDHRLTWRRRARQIRRGRNAKPVVAIALVDHFGDIVAAEPVLRHLRREHPQAHLVWILREPFRSLVEHHPDLDEVFTVGCLTEWLMMKGTRAFDRVVDLHLHGRFCDRCEIRADRTADGVADVSLWNYYEGHHLLGAFCHAGGLAELDETPRVHMDRASRKAVDALGLPERYVVIHGRSNQAERDWNEAGWRALAEHLAKRGVAVVEVGLEPVLQAGGPQVDLTRRLSLLQTAEVIRRARLFVGIDSGPAHLANAARTPGVLLLGAYTGFRGYMPWSGAYRRGEGATILRAEGPAATLSVEGVIEAVDAALRGARPEPAKPEMVR